MPNACSCWIGSLPRPTRLFAFVWMTFRVSMSSLAAALAVTRCLDEYAVETGVVVEGGDTGNKLWWLLMGLIPPQRRPWQRPCPARF